jgi:hypothetical protein
MKTRLKSANKMSMSEVTVNNELKLGTIIFFQSWLDQTIIYTYSPFFFKSAVKVLSSWHEQLKVHFTI